MADIPQEVREATEGAIEALLAHYPDMTGASLERSREGFQRMYLAMFLAGKRAGMERAAAWLREQDGCGEWTEAAELFEQEFEKLVDAIRSENDGHG